MEIEDVMAYESFNEGAFSSHCEEAFKKYNLKVDNRQVELVLHKAEKEKENVMADTSLKNETINSILSSLDLTSLKTADSDESILEWVEKINKRDSEKPFLPSYATLCVYPKFAKLVRESLEVEKSKVCCVAGGFPSSQTFIEVKIAEVSLALHSGAEEIDVVLPVGEFISGNYDDIVDELTEIKSVCGEHTLKVILETALLKELDQVKKAAILAMYSGADFIKTSTGKDGSKADTLTFCTMCMAIMEYYKETGRKVGIKAAGGIGTTEQAIMYYSIAKTVLGKEWLKPELFRIGASSLAELLEQELLN